MNAKLTPSEDNIIKILCTLIKVRPDRYINNEHINTKIITQDYVEIWSGFASLPDLVQNTAKERNLPRSTKL